MKNLFDKPLELPKLDEVAKYVNQIGKNAKVPIKRGCPNKKCFCTGRCNDIIGFRDKHELE